MFRSIRWRLVASYVLITLMTASLVGVLTLSLVRRDIRQQETAHLTANAQAIASQATALVQPVVRHAELMELARTASFFANARVRILDSGRHVLADSGPGSDTDQFLWFEPTTRFGLELDTPFFPSGPVIVMMPHGDSLVVPGRRSDRFTLSNTLPPDLEVTVVRRIGGPWGDRVIFSTLPFEELLAIPAPDVDDIQRPALTEEETPRSKQVLTVPIGPPGRPLGYVELSNSPDFGSESLATTSRALLLAAGGATVMAVVFGLLVSRGLTAPLRSLIAVASRMSDRDLSARAPVQSKDEFGQLAGQFNQMADRLETSFAELAAERDTLRRFIADASHELRTPITALKTFNELLQGPAANEPGTRAEFLAESQIQLNRLEHITHNLLDLSRLDAGLVSLDLAEYPVQELNEAAAAALKTMAGEKGVCLSIREPIPHVILVCDRARVESALCNLLANAIKFTSSGGNVEIGAEQVGEKLRLWVSDDGLGIDPDDLPHIFERFYRGKNSPAESNGLGLAIVQSVVQAHDGRVSVDSQLGEGSRFVIELPIERTLKADDVQSSTSA
jgi:signal transduction histidine kinase